MMKLSRFIRKCIKIYSPVCCPLYELEGLTDEEIAEFVQLIRHTPYQPLELE